MMMVLSLALALIAPDGARAGIASPVGHWINPSGSAVVEITECGVDRYCGYVRWASAKAVNDAARGGTSRLIGTRVFHDFVHAGKDRWKGRLFIPDRNQTSPAEMRLVQSNALRVTGCAMRRLLCKGQTWTRTDPR